MSCCAGLNTIVTLNVPATNGEGALTDVSALVGEKSVEVTGIYSGRFIVLGSHDGTRFVPVLVFDSGAGVQSYKQTMNFILRLIKIRRLGVMADGVISMRLGSQAACACS